MNHFDVDAALKTMTILVDTREQPTDRSKRRLASFGCPYERCKLEFGDYSVKCDRLDLSSKVAIERKMDFSELALCYGVGRPRFTREFERAREAGAKLYILVENASWEKAYAGQYRSRMTPQALIASILAWLTRYNCQALFCKESTSGKLIYDVLYRELKTALEVLPDGNG